MFAVTVESLGIISLDTRFSALAAPLGFLARTVHGPMTFLLAHVANSCFRGLLNEVNFKHRICIPLLNAN